MGATIDDIRAASGQAAAAFDVPIERLAAVEQPTEMQLRSLHVLVGQKIAIRKAAEQEFRDEADLEKTLAAVTAANARLKALAATTIDVTAAVKNVAALVAYGTAVAAALNQATVLGTGAPRRAHTGIWAPGEGVIVHEYATTHFGPDAGDETRHLRLEGDPVTPVRPKGSGQAS